MKFQLREWTDKQTNRYTQHKVYCNSHNEGAITVYEML